jgi:hypothetical protein
VTKKTRKEDGSKTCSRCNRTLKVNNFYNSDSELFHDGYVHICKQCLKQIVNEDDMDSVYRILQAIDKPFLNEVWKSAKASRYATFGDYMRMLSSLHQYRNLTYADSIFPYDNGYVEDEEFEVEESVVTEEEVKENDPFNIKITKELKLKWGNYAEKDIVDMEKTYQEMLFANDISTPQHKKQLQFYCKLSMMMDKALQNNDIGTFEKLSRQFDTLIKSSGFRPIDRKSSDEATGMRNFSTIFQEVERNGFVPPIDVTLVENQDIVDRTIFYYANYVRKLVGMESLSDTPPDTPKVESGLNES